MQKAHKKLIELCSFSNKTRKRCFIDSSGTQYKLLLKKSAKQKLKQAAYTYHKKRIKYKNNL